MRADFQNQSWEIPRICLDNQPTGELDAVEGYGTLHEIPRDQKSAKTRRGMSTRFIRLIEKLGKDFPVKKIWIPEIKQYQIERLNEGAASSTMNKEKSALSRMFQVLMELRLDGREPGKAGEKPEREVR